MAADALRYFCLRCRRGLANDASLKDRAERDTFPAIRTRDEVRHDGCGGMVAMSEREALER